MIRYRVALNQRALINVWTPKILPLWILLRTSKQYAILWCAFPNRTTTAKFYAKR